MGWVLKKIMSNAVVDQVPANDLVASHTKKTSDRYRKHIDQTLSRRIDIWSTSILGSWLPVVSFTKEVNLRTFI